MSKTLTTSILSVLAFAITAHAEETTSELPITVTATRFAQPTATVLAPVTIVTRKEIDQLHARSLTDVMNTLPGIQVSSYGGRGQQSGGYVRGASSDETLVLMNGVRVNSATKGGFDFSSVPLNQVERIEFIRGARATVYGADAIGGVINIITYGTQGEQKTSLNGGAGSKGYRNANATSSFDVSDSQHLKLSAGYETEDGYNVHPVKAKTGGGYINNQETDGFLGKNAMIDYQNQYTENTEIYSGLHFRRNTVQSDGPSTSTVYKEAETWEQNTIYQLGARYHQDRYQSDLSTSFTDNDSYYYQIYPTNGSRYNPTSTFKTNQYQTTWANTYQLTDIVSIGGGLDWKRDVLLSDSKASGKSYFSDDYGRNNTGVYALTQANWDQWLAELSARSDDNQQYGTHDTWQAGLGWNFLPDYRVSARYGTAFRAPTFNDLYYPVTSTHGNSDLSPETSRNSEVSLEGASMDVSWRATAYRNDIRNMIAWESYYDASGNYLYSTPQNKDHAQIDGLELEAKFDTGIVQHKISADFMNPVDKETGAQLNYRARDTYKWTGSVNWDKWDASLTAQYQSQRYYYSYSSTGNTTITKFLPYTIWNAGLGYRITNQFHVGGRIVNLFDKEYTLVNGYKPAGQSFYVDASYQF